MVEIIEYALVFGITALMAGFSVVVVQGSLPVLHQTQGQAEFDELRGAAGSAAIQGSATVVLTLSNASIACSAGVIEFSSGGLSYSSELGYPCSFAYSGISCVCKVAFSQTTGVLGVQVQG